MDIVMVKIPKNDLPPEHLREEKFISEVESARAMVTSLRFPLLFIVAYGNSFEHGPKLYYTVYNTSLGIVMVQGEMENTPPPPLRAEGKFKMEG